MILLTEDQLNGLFNQLRGSCLKAYEQENAPNAFVLAAILNTPNPPLPVSEDREVWMEIGIKDGGELPEQSGWYWCLNHNSISVETVRIVFWFSRETQLWTDLYFNIGHPTHWLKKVKLSSLVLNSSK